MRETLKPLSIRSERRKIEATHDEFCKEIKRFTEAEKAHRGASYAAIYRKRANSRIVAHRKNTATSDSGKDVVYRIASDDTESAQACTVLRKRFLFKVSMNAELIQYLAQFMPLAPIQCDGCTREVEISKAIEREGKFFHSERCADIATAPIIKPQPEGHRVIANDGVVWDV